MLKRNISKFSARGKKFDIYKFMELGTSVRNVKYDATTDTFHVTTQKFGTTGNMYKA